MGGNRWTRRRFLVEGGRVAAGAAAVGLAGPAVLAAADPQPAEGQPVEGQAPTPLPSQDALSLAVAMIRFDTSHNGEGGITRPHAEWFAAQWPPDQVETEIVPTPKPDNVHCIARIRATAPAAPPLLFMGHSDVVSVERERWTVDPYAGEVRDGFLYGRGALDMKGANGATMAALLRHLREGATFDRDVIFVSDCDEEAGPYGGRWLAANHWDKVAAGAVVTEGGWFLAQADGVTPMLATVTCLDRVAALVELTTEGTTTHSSRPQPNSAIVRLNRAVARLADYQPDVFITPLARRHFEALAAATDDDILARAVRNMLGATSARRRNRAGALVVSRSPYPWLHNALMRPTLAFVIQSGGYRTNIIPGGAKTSVSVRLLPGGPGLPQILDEMRAAIGDDAVVVRHVGAIPGETPEAADERVAKGLLNSPAPYPDHPGGAADPTGVFAAIESAVGATYPGVTAVPTLFEAGTSTGGFRSKGIPVYGIYPYVIDDDSLERMHGNDERVGVDALQRASDLMYAFFGRFRRPAS